MRFARLWTLAAIALAIALQGCGSDPPVASKPVRGVIRGVDTQAALVTLEHDEIPGLMMAMTMPFPVVDPAILEGLSVGDEVDFVVKQEGERTVVTQIRRRVDEQVP
jgi:Cu/Ag efflux protein CusF